MGDKFYMIIDGEVSVRVPNPQCRDFKRRHEVMVEERDWQARAAERSKVLARQIAMAQMKKANAEAKILNTMALQRQNHQNAIAAM